MDTLLLVEDDKFMRHYIREQLEPHGILVLEAVSGKRSLEILQQHPVDVILLDLGLPDGSGLDFIGAIREYSDVPLIIVSSDGSENSRIKGLERGADDFVAKPVSAGELVARIHANLRRYRDPHPQEDLQRKGDAQIRFGEWTLDCAKFQIYDRAGRSAALTDMEFRLLKVLAENAGHVLNREDMARSICNGSYVPTPRAIDVKIARIRKKIGDDADGSQIIKTVRGVGYIFDHAKQEC